MNPYKGPINRIGFLLNNFLYLILLIGGGMLIDKYKNTYHFQLGFSLGYALFVAASLLIIISYLRRIQNTGLSLWIGLVGLVPFIGQLFYISLFFWPPKK